eukprot:scaffold26700_cov27-Prasinocladus_malaysianus.AAC.1
MPVGDGVFTRILYEYNSVESSYSLYPRLLTIQLAMILIAGSNFAVPGMVEQYTYIDHHPYNSEMTCTKVWCTGDR